MRAIRLTGRLLPAALNSVVDFINRGLYGGFTGPVFSIAVHPLARSDLGIYDVAPAARHVFCDVIINIAVFQFRTFFFGLSLIPPNDFATSPGGRP